MTPAAFVLAAISAICIGAFWPTLKVNFEASFVRRFVVPVLLIAVANCFVLASAIGWWTALAYPLLALVGTICISPFTSGKHLQKVILGGGIWLLGIFALLLAVAGLILNML